MFANRYPVLVDACSLAGALRRNLLLTLAQAEFYPLYWSREILDETEGAIARILSEKGQIDAKTIAADQRKRMETAFPEALVEDHALCLKSVPALPDPNDSHVVAAALKAQAALIVTENSRHFPAEVLDLFDLECCNTDTFVANTIALDVTRAVAAIARMRNRLRNPPLTPQELIRLMEAQALVECADMLWENIELL